METAFRKYYDEVGGALGQLLRSKDAQQKQMGQVLTRLEFENLMTALNLALSAQVSILNLYRTLSNFIDITQDHNRGLKMGQMVMEHLEYWPADLLAGKIGAEFVGVIDNIAKCQLLLKQYAAAEASYQKALSIWLKNESYEAGQIKKMSAGIHHQLGMVAQKQRQWEQAEKYYHKALEIQIEFVLVPNLQVGNAIARKAPALRQTREAGASLPSALRSWGFVTRTSHWNYLRIFISVCNRRPGRQNSLWTICSSESYR